MLGNWGLEKLVLLYFGYLEDVFMEWIDVILGFLVMVMMMMLYRQFGFA